MRALLLASVLLCSCVAAKPATFAGCEIVVRATDPALEPLCATAAEIAGILAGWLDPSTGKKATRPPTRDELYQAIKARRMNAPPAH